MSYSTLGCPLRGHGVYVVDHPGMAHEPIGINYLSSKQSGCH